MFKNVNGINMYYEEKGNGIPLVFIHGLGENADSWKYQIDAFSKDFRTISMDLRGHHRSDDGDDFITMEIYADDVIGLMDQLKIDKAHFVGLSMGGLICQEMTKKYQDRMISMTLSDAAGFYPEPMCTSGLDERLNRIDTKEMSEIGELIGKVACKANVDKKILDEAIKMFQLNRQKPYRQATFSTLKADYRDIHKDIKIPTYITVGELDPVTPIEFSVYLKEHIKDSRMKIVPDASHLSKMDNYSEYNKALYDFLISFK